MSTTQLSDIAWIKDIIYILPLAGLIWKGATMNSQVKRNSEEIKECKDIIQKQNEAIISSLNKLTDTMNDIKLDVSVLKALRDEEVGKKTTKRKTAN